MGQTRLPSWRAGAAREAIEIFLDGAEMLPLEQRVAVFDVDGTLWCEQPRYAMAQFLHTELRTAVEANPALAERPEYRAALDWDHRAIARLGAVNVVLALIGLHAGLTPEAYDDRVRSFFATARHPQRGVPLSQMRYRPMLELIGELRARDFDVFVVTGSGLEFVRVVSHRFFGVKPEGVVGSQVGYELVREAGRPWLRRIREIVGDPNEGAAKVVSIQRLLGRRPILAVGNSAGDAEMLDYAQAFEGPSLALLVDHDDREREYEYSSTAVSVELSEPIGAVAERHGWTVISMRDDWETIFADA